ncbi:MAG: integral rane protein [Thermomicrobiales bacterium]|nr:integral rane protein [Thermomicrobiales bacterium]
MSVDQPLSTPGVAHSPLDGLIDPTATLGADQNIPGFREEDYPALYRAANAASRRARMAHTRLVGAELALLVGAAVIGAAQSLLPGSGSGWERAFPAVLLVAALIAKLANRLQRFDEHWFDGRAVAETVKSATWRYVMGVRPYDGAGTQPETTLGEALRDALAARPALAAHLHRLPAGARQVVTERMRQVRRMPAEQRHDYYLTERVDNQEAWYAGKSQTNSRAATVWFWVSLLFEGLALAAAIMVAVTGFTADLLGPLAAITAAATAWTQLGRHDELAKSYGLAAHELMVLHSRLELADSEEAFRQGVEETESAISREHTMWMAKRG